MKRRQFLKASGAGLGVAAGFASNLASFNAFAADNSQGYRALVCVFFRGGMDTHDMIIPYDVASSQLYEAIRAPLLNDYAVSRRRDNLLALQGTGGSLADGSLPDGRSFALPQEMVELRDLYRAEKLAVVGNVGPLVEPLTATTFANNSALAPARLFSHNDQESTWMAGSAEGAKEGWGGRFGDVMEAANVNSSASFTTVTTSGTSVFVNGLNVNGFSLSTGGGEAIRYLNGGFGESSVFGQAYRNNLRGANADYGNVFLQDVGNIAARAMDDNMLVSQVFSQSSDPTTQFPATNLGNQLRIVAKMIANREALGMHRQIFFVSDNGYDTHFNQAQSNVLPQRQLEISQAMSAFYNETETMGVADSVTSFTASDFGRSLVPNHSGTDHGWGSHHMVMGGAVKGGRIYGNIPEAAVGHSQDSGRGRLIPELSIEQYATALGVWFGLTVSECFQLFPNLGFTNPRALYGLFFDERP